MLYLCLLYMEDPWEVPLLRVSEPDVPPSSSRSKGLYIALVTASVLAIVLFTGVARSRAIYDDDTDDPSWDPAWFGSPV